jgi:prephenate dehydrogenase
MVNLMANVKTDEKLYDRLRANGLRKKVARQLSELPSQVSDGKQAPKALRDAVDRLEAITKELKGHTRSGDRKAAARKAARTRKAKADQRARSARKGARTRAT